MSARTIDVSEFVERQQLSRFLIGLVALSWLITFLDGLDANLISFAAPYFVAGYGLTKPQTANIFSGHQLGTLAGGLLLPFLGDRIGRRPAVIFATAAFGILTMAFYFADGYGTLLTLRFLDGIPLGGTLPLAWALNIEYAPKRYRATIVTVVMIGYSLGTALGGPIANLLIPRFGWKAIFLVGGAAAVATSLMLVWKLPESIRFLASTRGDSSQISRMLRRMAHWEAIPSDAAFVVGDEPGHIEHFRPALLFQGSLARITPLLWIAYIASSFAVFLTVNWTPIIFEALGYTREQAASSSALYSLMGAAGGIALMRFTDTRGPIMITFMPVVCAVLLLLAGTSHWGSTAFLMLMAAVGFFLIGGHFGMHSICGLYYPSSYRANGAGWATSIAKVGSIGGPLVGGWILASTLPIRALFAVLAICPLIFAVCIYSIGRIQCPRTAVTTPEALARQAAGS